MTTHNQKNHYRPIWTRSCVPFSRRFGDLILNIKLPFLCVVLLALYACSSTYQKADDFDCSYWNIENQSLRPVFIPPPITPKDLQHKNNVEACAIVAFTVTEIGRVEDVRIVGESPARKKLGFFASKAAKKMIYKPPLADGKPTRVENVEYKYVFRKDEPIILSKTQLYLKQFKSCLFKKFPGSSITAKGGTGKPWVFSFHDHSQESSNYNDISLIRFLEGFDANNECHKTTYSDE